MALTSEFLCTGRYKPNLSLHLTSHTYDTKFEQRYAKLFYVDKKRLWINAFTPGHNKMLMFRSMNIQRIYCLAKYFNAERRDDFRSFCSNLYFFFCRNYFETVKNISIYVCFETVLDSNFINMFEGVGVEKNEWWKITELYSLVSLFSQYIRDVLRED